VVGGLALLTIPGDTGGMEAVLLTTIGVSSLIVTVLGVMATVALARAK
jgi:hypothetical protein